MKQRAFRVTSTLVGLSLEQPGPLEVWSTTFRRKALPKKEFRLTAVLQTDAFPGDNKKN
jgi:hypothetical protein